MKKSYLTLTAVVLSFFFSPFIAQAETPKDIQAKLEKLISNVGGKDIWANAHGISLLTIIFNEQQALPFSVEFCWNWDTEESLTLFKNQSISRLMVYSNGAGWTVTKAPGQEPSLQEWDENRIAFDRKDWNANFSRLLHRIAKDDDQLSFSYGEGEWDGWIEVKDGEDVASYMQLDEEGNIGLYQNLANPVPVKFKPLVNRGEFSFPLGGKNDLGSDFVFPIVHLINHPLSISYQKRADLGDLSLGCR